MLHTDTAAKLAELAPAMRTITDAADLYPYDPAGTWRGYATPYGYVAVSLGLEDTPRGAGATDPGERPVLHVQPAYAVTDDGHALTNETDLAPHYRGGTRTEAVTAHPAAVDVEGITQRNAALIVNGRPYTASMTARHYRDGGELHVSAGLGELTDSARVKLAAVFAPILAELDTPAARDAIRVRRAVTHAASAVTDAQRKLTDALDTLTAAGLIGGTR